ncbi:MAG: YpmA family protein [Bacillota bacterium]
MEGNQPKLQIKAVKTVKTNGELYKIIDFLNKNLKDNGVMLGLTKNKEDDTMSITIYEI